MTTTIDHSAFWALVRRQHGVISREQLLGLGFSASAIRHRVARGRLVPLWRGVFAVGRLAPTREALWMAAVLAAGPGAALSHASAAALWSIHPTGPRLARVGVKPVHISIPADRRVRLQNIRVHRRTAMPPTTTKDGIPLSQPLFSLVDLATTLGDRELEAAINEADKLGLIRPQAAADALVPWRSRPGVQRLRRLLGTHKRTDSDLERAFLRLILKAGLPEPTTQTRVNGERVDFHWPELKLVVETDGAAYHRTRAQQLADRRRDQAHTRAGLTPLRFLDEQIETDAAYVVETLRAVIEQRE